MRGKLMFIAMNRFHVVKGCDGDFEHVWLSRDSRLENVPGFVEFELLKGPQSEDHTLYASHTIWESRSAFEAWTRSEAFRAAHQRTGERKPLYIGQPQFEGFDVRQVIRAPQPESIRRTIGCFQFSPCSTCPCLPPRARRQRWHDR